MTKNDYEDNNDGYDNDSDDDDEFRLIILHIKRGLVVGYLYHVVYCVFFEQRFPTYLKNHKQHLKNKHIKHVLVYYAKNIKTNVPVCS